MNKVSIVSSSIKSCILLGIFFAGFLVLMVIKSVAAYFCLIWIIGCVIKLISNFNIYDIHLNDSTINLISIKKKWQIKSCDIKINNIIIQRYPVFHLETNKGYFNINYTRDNYSELLRVLEHLKYFNINKFKESVIGYIVSPS
jgi:hypothetical protein